MSGFFSPDIWRILQLSSEYYSAEKYLYVLSCGVISVTVPYNTCLNELLHVPLSPSSFPLIVFLPPSVSFSSPVLSFSPLPPSLSLSPSLFLFLYPSSPTLPLPPSFPSSTFPLLHSLPSSPFALPSLPLSPSLPPSLSFPLSLPLSFLSHPPSFSLLHFLPSSPLPPSLVTSLAGSAISRTYRGEQISSP